MYFINLLTPLSPRYQPIEHLFGWLKNKLRGDPAGRNMPYQSVYATLGNVTVGQARNMIDHIY